MKNKLTVGIDFGTTNTVISFFNKSPQIFKDSIKDFIPTKIFFDDSISCGNNIPIEISDKSKKILSNFKVKIGNNLTFNYKDKELSEFEILTVFFKHLMFILLKKFPDTTFNTILTVPSNFNDIQRSVLINVCKYVGFNILRVINEPTAAAFAYGIDSNINEETVMVFDLGGGTLDISILEIEDNFFETIDSIGVNDLGGNDFTNLIYDDCIKEFKSNMDNKSILISKNKLIQLWYNCNKAKEKLTWVDSCTIEVKDFLINDDKHYDLKYNLDIIKFKNLSEKLLERIQRKLKLLDKEYNISKLILVGGSSKMKIIQDLLENVLKIKPLVHNQLQHVVSLGATYYGALIQNELTNNDIILVDNLPLSLGIETAEGSFSPIILKNTPLPATRSKKYTIDTPGEEEVLVKVYQGERSIAKKNFFIGEFTFNKISKINQPIINISFKVDINGIINVSIEDKHSGSNKDILIRNNVEKKENLDNILKIASQNEEMDSKEQIKNQLFYKLEIRLEHILSNLKTNNLIKEDLKKETSEELLQEMDNLSSKTIQELIKLDKRLDEDFFVLSQSNFENVETSNNLMNIEHTIKKEKLEFLKSKIDFYFTKTDNEFQLDCLKKLNNSLNEKDMNNIDLDDKINYLRELFKENDRDELLQLCLFLKEEIQNFNLNLNEKENGVLSLIVEKYLKMLDENNNFDYKAEINNLNEVCKKLIEK